VKISTKFENFSVKRAQCSNTISCHLGHLAALGRIIFVCVANPDSGMISRNSSQSIFPFPILMPFVYNPHLPKCHLSASAGLLPSAD